MSSIEIRSVDEILNWNLEIPEYQRPYKWDIKNINELLIDIESAIRDSRKNKDFKYRIGTIILHQENDKDAKSDIVDGQQRIVSLVLIKLCLDNNFNSVLLEKEFSNKETIYNINRNYKFIRGWYELKEDNEKDDIKKAFNAILEAVVIKVENISEAFQLFDCQNNRGKSLVPHDLLKAYHLREMRDYKVSDVHEIVKQWEAVDNKEIEELYEKYLFPILNWSMGRKSHDFSHKDIDEYKGVEKSSSYTYAKILVKLRSCYQECYQITEPIIAGEDFFKMTRYYLDMLKLIDEKICHNKEFKIIRDILLDGNTECDDKNLREIEYKSFNLEKARNLFYCAVLYYYDRFGNLDSDAVKKLFVWAFMLRMDMSRLGFDSVNKYAIGEPNSLCTNKIAVFSIIRNARRHQDISRLLVGIKLKEKAEEKNNNIRKNLYEQFKELLNQ